MDPSTIWLRNKCYWRPLDPSRPHTVLWCCFVACGPANRKRVYVSLCGRHELPKSYGGDSRRPEPEYRCARCDGEEAKRLKLEESAPTLVPLRGKM